MTDKARSEHFLLKVDQLIDWEALAALIQPPGSPAHAGLTQEVAKMLLLARWYSMNDAEIGRASCRERV